MRTKRILLLGYNWPLNVVRLPQLFAEGGYRVDALFPRGFSVDESRHLSTCYWSDGNRQDYMSQLRSVLQANVYDLYILADEAVLRMLSDEEERFCIRRMGNLPLDPLRLQSLYDKAAFTELGQLEKWPLPESHIFENSQQAIEYGVQTMKYPFVLKGAYGAGGWRVQIFKSDEDLQSIKSSFEQPGLWILQRYITGESGCLEGLYHRGQLLGFIASTEYRKRNGETSQSASRRLFCHPQLQVIAQQIGNSLGYTGFFGFDFQHDRQSDQIYVLELHGRAASGYHLGKRVGVDFAKVFSEMSDGVDVCVAIDLSRSGELYSLYPQYFSFLKSCHSAAEWLLFVRIYRFRGIASSMTCPIGKIGRFIEVILRNSNFGSNPGADKFPDSLTRDCVRCLLYIEKENDVRFLRPDSLGGAHACASSDRGGSGGFALCALVA